MTFLYLSAEGGAYVREHFNPEVYHIDNIKGNSCFAFTANLEQSYYFLRTVNHLDEIEQLYPELFI